MTKIAVSFLKLFDNEVFIRDGFHSVPIYETLGDNYLTEAKASSKIQKGAYFMIRTKHHSTLYSQTPVARLLAAANRLHSFFKETYSSTRKGYRTEQEYFDIVNDLLMFVEKNVKSVAEGEVGEAPVVISATIVCIDST